MMRLLIVGSMRGHASLAAKLALKRGAKVNQVDDIDLALATLRAGRGADLIMIDLSLDVARFIETLERERISAQVIACGISSDPEEAVLAIKAGAKEYIPLPPDADLIAAVFEAVSQSDKALLSRDPALLRVVAMADRVAPTEANILITGESGTGKEVMAHYLHKKSKRASKPFISINCAAIPENLLESELFGHEKGAFTGAIAQRIGKFEEANEGTLLLDEISEMEPRLQAKLLRAIQERVIDRVGGSRPVPVNIRIIATSNRDMLKEVAEGRFRDDLYFRLNVVNLQMIPLRERPLDIEYLAQYFVKKFSTMNQLPLKSFSLNAMDALQAHEWKGNVRELENSIHRAVVLSTGECIEPIDLFPFGHTPITGKIADKILGAADPFLFVGRAVADVEKDLILNTVDHCLGNRTHAAHILGISIRTLRNKLNEYAEHRKKDKDSSFVDAHRVNF